MHMTDIKIPTIIIEGGIGKHVMFTALIPKLYEKYGKFNLVSAYPDVFSGYGDYINVNTEYSNLKKKFVSDVSSEFIFREPYKGNFALHKNKHLLDAWATELGVVYNGELPKIKFDYTSNTSITETISKLLDSELKDDFIIVQFTGGQSPLNFNSDSSYRYNSMIDKRNYPLHYAKYLIRRIKEEYPNLAILDYSLPNEYPKIDGTVRTTMPYLGYYELAKRAKKVIGIDSSLLHIATAAKADVIGLYGGIPAWEFGYSNNTNLSNFKGGDYSEDNPSYIGIDPETILKEI